MLLTFYGDDFTGSTDVMESLQCAGVATVLFVDLPTPELAARFPDARAAGIAGSSRTMSPAQMKTKLPPAFEMLRTFGAPIVHYKVCSTFDSSPQIGSIGQAIDIGRRMFPGRFVPMVVGAPVLGRYCAFGNLFARSGLDSAPYRLDRHPTMSRHPVTPMNEADLRRHLARQTRCPVSLVDLVTLDCVPATDAPPMEQLLPRDCRQLDQQIVLFDTATEAHLARAGQQIWDLAQRQKPLFAVGSSGVEYALTSHWRSAGLLTPESSPRSIDPADRVAVLSGSCSPVTEQQIAWAVENGFAEVALDTPSLVDDRAAAAAHAAAMAVASKCLDSGKSVVLHTSRGPQDGRIGETRDRLPTAGESAEKLGRALGRLARDLVGLHHLKRLVFTGGDSSGFAARELEISALQYAGPVAPGSPLCRAHSKDPLLDGIEVTFKGGQVGRPDFFGQTLSRNVGPDEASERTFN